MAQQGQDPQADVLWQSQDGKKKFIFSLQAHRGSAMEQYAQFQGSQGEEGAAYAPLPELSPDLWEVVSGHVQTFMSNLGTSGYSVDLRVPMDILDPSLPDNTCRFGCGADESMLQQAHESGLTTAGPPIAYNPSPPQRWITDFSVPHLNGVRRGIQSNKVTRSGLCHVVYDGQGRDMLVYQLCSPPVPRGRFHELHDLPAWLVPLTYQDIILDLKERFPYLEAYTISVNFGNWIKRPRSRGSAKSDVHFKVTSHGKRPDFIYARWRTYNGYYPTGQEEDEIVLVRKFGDRFVRSVEPPADWPPSFDTTPCADDFASKAVEIQRAFIARMQQDMQVLPNHIDRLTQDMQKANIAGPSNAAPSSRCPW